MNSLTATIFITDKCNLACKYCYEKDKATNINNTRNIDKFLNLILTNKRFSEFDSIVIDFIGGEALLEYSLMEYAMEAFIMKCKSLNHKFLKNFTFFVSTNGTLFENKEIKAFLDRWPCLKVGVSLDGCKEAQDMNRVYKDGKGSYDTVMKSFEWWKNKYKTSMVKGTLSPDTLPLLDKMLINQAKLGMKKLWANPIYEHDWTDDEGKIYKQKMFNVIDWIFANNKETEVEPLVSSPINAKDIKKVEGDSFHYCGTCNYMITLGIDGKLYPCHRFATSTNHKYSIGDVDNGIDESKVKIFNDSLAKIDSEYIDTFDPICYSAYHDREGLFKNYNSIHNIIKYNKDIDLYWKEKLNYKKYKNKIILEINASTGEIYCDQDASSTSKDGLYNMINNLFIVSIRLLKIYKSVSKDDKKIDELVNRIILSLEDKKDGQA